LAKEATRVFVSYRREDTRHVAGRLADRLDEHFHVFMDIDTIEPGMDFTETIRNAVTECDVFVAVIGNQWTKALDESGQRRLDDPNDWVTAETAAALQRGVPVIPVLVDGARMPTRSELPEALAGLASRQAVPLRHESFTSDASRLVAAIERRSPATAHGQPDVASLPPGTLRQTGLPPRVGGLTLSRHWKRSRRSTGRTTRWRASSSSPVNSAGSPSCRQRSAGTELAGLDPAKADPDGLVSRAREALGDTRRRQLAALFDKAVQAEAKGRWNEAADALQQITSLDAQSADIARRLASVRARLGAGGAVPPQLGGQPPGSPNAPGPGWGAPTIGADGGAGRIPAAPPGGYPPGGPAGFVAMPPPKKKPHRYPSSSASQRPPSSPSSCSRSCSPIRAPEP
jgi:TIR domain-containing protein